MNRVLFFLVLALLAALPDISTAQTPKQWDYAPGGCPNDRFAPGSHLFDPNRHEYFFAPLPETAERPAIPLAITVWRLPCEGADTSALRLRVTPNAGGTAFRPQVTIVQDGIAHGCTGPQYSGDNINPYLGECLSATGLFVYPPPVGECSPMFGLCIPQGYFQAYMTTQRGSTTATLSLATRLTTFDPDRAFSLHIRGNWRASVPDLVYEIPAKNAPGNVGRVPQEVAGQWWNPAEPGWGLVLDRNERGAMFAAWLTYDDNGDTTWFVMTNSTPDPAGGVVGDVHALRGQSFAMPNAEATIAGDIVGRFRLSFTTQTRGEFSYVVNGRSGSSPIQRMEIRSQAGGLCTYIPYVMQVNGLPGWAVQFEGGVAQAGCGLHATLMTYDGQGKPMWIFGGLLPNQVRPGGGLSVSPLYGALYRPRSTPYGRPYEAGRLAIGPAVGVWDAAYGFLRNVDIEVNGVRRRLDFDRFRFEY